MEAALKQGHAVIKVEWRSYSLRVRLKRVVTEWPVGSMSSLRACQPAHSASTRYAFTYILCAWELASSCLTSSALRGLSGTSLLLRPLLPLASVGFNGLLVRLTRRSSTVRRSVRVSVVVVEPFRTLDAFESGLFSCSAILLFWRKAAETRRGSATLAVREGGIADIVSCHRCCLCEWVR